MTDNDDAIGRDGAAEPLRCDGTGTPPRCDGTGTPPRYDGGETPLRCDGGEHLVAHVPRVKICGHTSAADLRDSVAAGADAVGVIADVSVDTPREVSVERAAELLDAVPPLATGVLVAMPEDVARAVELVGRTSPDAIQVHGTLAPEALADLRERVHVDVIAAIDAAEPSLADYADAADALLVDTPAEDGGGGTGETHDWEGTREATADLDVPVVLAGGLTPENVADAVETASPFGVDVASGVESGGGRASEASPGSGDERSESAGGVKDADAVERFVREARRAPPDSAAPADASATEGSR